MDKACPLTFPFSGVKSKTTGRCKDYLGINGETCWILITDHHTGMQYGKTCQSKASPIEQLREWLQVYSPNLRDKYVFMDQGGELYDNPDILNVFTNHHYQIHPTGTGREYSHLL